MGCLDALSILARSTLQFANVQNIQLLIVGDVTNDPKIRTSIRTALEAMDSLCFKTKKIRLTYYLTKLLTESEPSSVGRDDMEELVISKFAGLEPISLR